MPQEYRLYQDLAAWWPLISPPDVYTAEAAYLNAVLAAAPGPVHDVLDLGSGGGNVAAHLKAGRALTLVDLSAEMLAVSRELNPDCDHEQGDMRTIRLGCAFDAVLVHDAVDYMTTEADLRQVIETAWAHCRPGGIGLFVPDYTAESFRIASGHGGSSDPSGRQASFREWTWDPDPDDDWIQSEYEFVLRDTGRLGPGGERGPPAGGVRAGNLARAAARRRLRRGVGGRTGASRGRAGRRGGSPAAAQPVHRPAPGAVISARRRWR